MNTPPSPPGVERTDKSAVRIGALVPLTRLGWVEAGQHLLAGLKLAVCEVNDAGGIVGSHSSWWSETPRLIHRGPRRP